MHIFLAHIFALSFTVFLGPPAAVLHLTYCSHHLRLLPLQLLNMQLKYFAQNIRKGKKTEKKGKQERNFSAKSRRLSPGIGQTLSQRIQFNFHNCNRIGNATFTFHFYPLQQAALYPAFGAWPGVGRRIGAVVGATCAT